MKPSPSQLLLSQVRSELKRRGMSISGLARELGNYNYFTIYFIIHPEKRNIRTKRRPTFAYDLGIRISNWLLKSKQSVN